MLRLFPAALFFAALCLQAASLCAAPDSAFPEIGQGATLEASPESPATPSADVPETTHDFGKVQPNQVCEHTFIVRNRGNDVLRIIRVAAG